MHRTGPGNATKNGEGLLKTTTWGTLIALSLLAAAFGFKGSFSSSPDESAALQAQAPQESAPLELAQNAANPAAPGSSVRSQSRSSVTPFVLYGGSGSTPAHSHPRPAGSTPLTQLAATPRGPTSA